MKVNVLAWVNFWPTVFWKYCYRATKPQICNAVKRKEKQITIWTMFLAQAAQTTTTTCLSCLSWKMVAKWNGIWPSSSLCCQGENVFAYVAFQASGLDSVSERSELRYDFLCFFTFQLFCSFSKRQKKKNKMSFSKAKLKVCLGFLWGFVYLSE